MDELTPIVYILSVSTKVKQTWDNKQSKYHTAMTIFMYMIKI